VDCEIDLKRAPSLGKVIKVVEDLLTIAKVAIPEDLYEVDPRIIKAKALVRWLKEPIDESAPRSLKAVEDLKAIAAAPPEEQATWRASHYAGEYAQTENATARPMRVRRKGSNRWRHLWSRVRTILLPDDDRP